MPISPCLLGLSCSGPSLLNAHPAMQDCSAACLLVWKHLGGPLSPQDLELQDPSV